MVRRPLFLSIRAVFLTSVLFWTLLACSRTEPTPKVLVFSKTTGFRHESIPQGIAAIRQLGAENGFSVDTTEDAGKFTGDNLKQYRAIVFLNTTGDVLNLAQQTNFERYIQAGGGYVGVHSATDTEYSWPWYNQLAGAYFQSHPNDPNVRKATIDVLDKSHPSTRHLPDKWTRTDEWYNFKSLNPEVKILANLDEKSYEGGTNGDNHPAAWYHEFDGGRAFYTAGGHTSESYSEPEYVQHLLGGIRWAMGEGKELSYQKSNNRQVPEDNRFTKTTLAENLDEPMEVAVAPDGRVFFIERKGLLKQYEPGSGKTSVIGRVDVFYKNNDGLLGLALDPEFRQNNRLYLYYSPAGETPRQYLSRFTIKDDKLDVTSEKILLEIPTQRQECCHSGGSVAFGPDGLLYVSVGDNTSPFGTPYAPIDERKGRSAWDAQQSSANTNDLRGKILRIRPQPDGSYTIPEGNLFPKGTPNARPEIYTMGNRNPFRISIDAKTNALYWGEIGPDAGKDSTAGPKGYDEINRTRQAGNFGWPYFVGDNQAYPQVNFTTNQVGAKLNPQAPVNDSPNNTGIQQLPPAQPAFIWYPYDESSEFPVVGKGGRNAMAGPVFYVNDYADSGKRFPQYYDGKLFIYDWMRGWIMAVSIDKAGNLQQIEPFAPSLAFTKPMDMQFGPDGAMYLLEYGTYWYSQNDDARLVRVDYNEGNRKPVVQLAANKKAGAAPLTVQFSTEGTLDYDGDKLSYRWQFDGADAGQVTSPNPTFSYNSPGRYTPTVTVTDRQGESTTAQVEIRVGNAEPQVSLELDGNRTFFWDNETLPYQVKVTDAEDGTLANGGINPENVALTLNYLPHGEDVDQIEQGHQEAQASVQFMNGKKLIEASDCKACHAVDKKSVGPSYQDVAARYKKDKKAVDRLAAKIISGGGGNWGKQAMSAHPQLTRGQTTEMVQYILSLADESVQPKLPLQGTFTMRQPASSEEGRYLITASYADKGANSIPSLTGRETIILRYPRLQAEHFHSSRNVQKNRRREDNTPLIRGIRNGSYISFKPIDLTNVAQLAFRVIPLHGGTIEIHLGAPDGKRIGVANIAANTGKSDWTRVEASLEKTTATQEIFFVFTNEQIQNKDLFELDWVHFQHKESKSLASK